jgi:glycerol-3-phosphate dehydrogenase
VLTRCRALTLSGAGAEARDEFTGAMFTIRARSVINAAGVWAGALVRFAPVDTRDSSENAASCA